MPRLLLLALVAAGLGACAHAPAPAPDRCLVRAVVTGSRIPQRVDARTGLPATVSPVLFYDVHDLQVTGHDGDLAGAMRASTPRLGTTLDAATRHNAAKDCPGLDAGS